MKTKFDLTHLWSIAVVFIQHACMAFTCDFKGQELYKFAYGLPTRGQDNTKLMKDLGILQSLGHSGAFGCPYPTHVNKWKLEKYINKHATAGKRISQGFSFLLAGKRKSFSTPLAIKQENR